MNRKGHEEHKGEALIVFHVPALNSGGARRIVNRHRPFMHFFVLLVPFVVDSSVRFERPPCAETDAINDLN